MQPAVLIVEDHPFTLATLLGALGGRGMQMGGAPSAREALDLIDTWSPEVAVLDLDLGTGPTGLDLARVLRERLPAVGIVLLTSFRDPRLAARGLPMLPQGGVYLCKADVHDLDLLVDAILAAQRQPLARRKAVPRSAGPTAALTDNQVDVLMAVASGATTAQIAAERGITASAVEQTIARICDRLQIPRDPALNQRVQLVQAVQQLSGRDG